MDFEQNEQENKMMGMYKILISILGAGIMLALFWLIIGMVFSQSLELSDFVRSLTVLFWLISFVSFVAWETSK